MKKQTFLKILMLVCTLHSKVVSSSYAPLASSADSIDHQMKRLNKGVGRLEDDLQVLPSKFNVSIPDGNDTQVQVAELQRQVDEKKSNLSVQSEKYYADVRNATASLTDASRSAAEDIDEELKDEIRYRVNITNNGLLEVQDDLLLQLDTFQRDAASTQDQQVQQMDAELDDLVGVYVYLMRSYGRESAENIHSLFGGHEKTGNVEQYNKHKSTVTERYPRLPSRYLERSAFAQYGNSQRELYQALQRDMRLDDDKGFNASSRASLRAEPFRNYFPLVNETRAGLFNTDLNHTHVLMDSLSQRHANISNAVTRLEEDLYKPERRTLRHQKRRYVELLHRMAMGRDSYYTLRPLLSSGNMLSLILLGLLLLLLLALTVLLAYWVTPQPDCRRTMRPPRPMEAMQMYC